MNIYKSKIRKGRGKSSPKGRRSGRGNKGTGARNSGFSRKSIQSGGQNPFYRMHGKIGFKPKKNKWKEIDYNKLKPETNIT